MGELKPSTCTSESWLWADNMSSFNNKIPTEKCGKWMIFPSKDTIDENWNILKKATEEGKLGFRSKVSTQKDSRDPRPNERGLICVYTYDWTDEADVMRVREELRNLGFTWRLPYKTDEDTYNNIYRATGHKHISKYFC